MALAAARYVHQRIDYYVYFEVSSVAPYQVRRIEELNKTANGNVEAKVMCFYRRRDISPTLLNLADRHQKAATVSPICSSVVGGLSNGFTAGSANSPERISLKTDVDSDESAIDKQGARKPAESNETDCSDNGLPALDGFDAKAGPTVGLLGMESLSDSERHQLKHRELFLSRQIETLPATHIRGKCAVTLLNETETSENYLGKEDGFFYSLVYDPQQKTLLADKGEIRKGEKFQAMVTDSLAEEQRHLDRLDPLDTLVFHPHHSLTDRQIDQFLIIARAVGTFSRALDSTSSVKQPSLHMSAAAASRDITLFHAMALLHQANYDLGKGICYLVPPPSKQHYPLDVDRATAHNTISLGGPVLCRDQMEEWSAAEANLFEEALEKYGKDFNDIRQDFLPWKALKDIVEYYYMWKTTDRYVQQKRVKAVEAESRLKQVYIPNYNKPNPAAIAPNNPPGQFIQSNKACESCSARASLQWYTWGPIQLQSRLCQDCWTYWKKYGGLKIPHKFDLYDKLIAKTEEPCPVSTSFSVPGIDDRFRQRQQVHQHPGLPPAMKCTMPGCNKEFRIRALFSRHFIEDHGTVPPWEQQSLNPRTVPKTRAAFFLHTTLLTKIARRLAPKQLLHSKCAARKPFIPINMLAIKQNCQGKAVDEIALTAKTISRRSAEAVKCKFDRKQIPLGSARPTIAANANINMATRMAVLSEAERSSPQSQTALAPSSSAHGSAQNPSSGSEARKGGMAGVAHALTGAASRKRPQRNGFANDGPAPKRTSVTNNSDSAIEVAPQEGRSEPAEASGSFSLSQS